MPRRLTRRDVLAAAGAVALGSLAGCSGRGSGPRFWDDPPSLDVEGVPREFDRPVPDPPRIVPVDVEPAVAAAFADRVDRLLSSIPEPLTGGTLPNGAIREQIETERAGAREALPESDEALPPLEAAERYATARDRAATAAGTWAAVTVEGDPAAVTAGIGTVRNRAFETLEELPGPAADPVAGAAVYGPIERWYDEARRRTLVGSGPADQANPLRTGDAAGEVERVQSLVESGRYLRDRYAASLADPEAVAEPLRREMNRLGRAVGDRLRELHGEGVEDLRQNPGTDAFVDDRAVARGAPSAALLSSAVYRSFDDMWFDPVAFDDYEPDDPATGLTRTALAWTRLRALGDVADRVEAGETMFPDDAAAVGAARTAAVESAAALAGSENPLARWLATQFLPLFAEPEGALAAGDRNARSTVEAYTRYRWIETVTGEARTVAASVEDSFEAN
ncbi:hypothetical protein C465_02436 [Halorubrum distributum JCM 9100]|uniref:Uncharacterized protein n=2 Tax=Halorubrum distributum TaxID=29283 RepID=M0EW33_9EURY|nr:hypothetical protein [Halorubrum distributum]ELZ51930.1 hypothetical protein C465_02436 [Halorubrum distributum JCM 9100]ELZ52105.1 hypothetical protein C466_12683 [Halorubrum distributum JCM 10118]